MVDYLYRALIYSIPFGDYQNQRAEIESAYHAVSNIHELIAHFFSGSKIFLRKRKK
jgi:hypothetical protein